MPADYIDPIETLGELLLTVEKPARYVGGEFGCLAKKEPNNNEILRTLIAFPDLYEIGMGNQALKIIYNYLNNIPGINCDRAFAPAVDFEKLLRKKNIPLYGLDTGISLASVDLLMFTLGYELGLNGILTMLDVSGIPLRCEERHEGRKTNKEYPIVFAGGPAVSNPLPYSPFIDALWIGEAEAGFFELAASLAGLKRRGQSRGELLEKIAEHSNVWVKGKEKAVRAIYAGFSHNKITPLLPQNPSLVYPIPSMKIAQNHGIVEIMRGCPNGCRFCHAGFWYRPARQKDPKLIEGQVNELINKGGWQQISLSSLSSGDYLGIDQLIDNLNSRFAKKQVSFQLPSLKVTGFALSLLEKISVTRKSGLTFAIETPQDLWQMAINKEVSREFVTDIINEAKRRGWKGAKFYFMIGLPAAGRQSESEACEIREINIEEEIISFVLNVARRTKMHFNINVGIFIPKPHTPYQWTAQIDSEIALKKLLFIRSKLKPMGHKVSISDPLISKIEGLLSRGDENAGLLCEEAWKGGSRLEPWNEYINKDIWQEIIEKNSEYVNSVFSGKNIFTEKKQLPWFQIDSCIKNEYVKQELEKSNLSCRTGSCREKCNFCGLENFCAKTPLLQEQKTPQKEADIVVNLKSNEVNRNGARADPAIYRMLFSFTKEGCAVFHGHLSLIEVFSMALRRAGIPNMYTQGFNPLAKMEFASSLSTGITASSEAAVIDFYEHYPPADFVNNLNMCLPHGIRINKASMHLIKSGVKKRSLSSLLWGFAYEGADNNLDYVKAAEEKNYRNKRLESGVSSLFFLRRSEVLAKNVFNDDAPDEWASYFDVYSYLYP